MGRLNISEKIEVAFENRKEEKPRRYIGASIIGSECDAYLALSMRGFPGDKPSSRLKRIFRDGHRIEDVVIADMKEAGLYVIDRDPMTGKQFEYSDYGGHVSSHADGVLEDGDDVVLLEIKSMNDKKWKAFRDGGVKKSHPIYYAQMQYMMGRGGMRHAVLVAYNKNTSEYHAEEVVFDTFFYSSLKVKVERIVESGTGQRIAKDRSDFRCGGCFKRSACWQLEEVKPQCSYCQHAFPADNRQWECRHPTEPKGVMDAEDKCSNYVRFVPRSR